MIFIPHVEHRLSLRTRFTVAILFLSFLWIAGLQVEPVVVMLAALQNTIE